MKYGFGPDVVFHWDNVGFDGPVIAAPRAYEIPDNTVATTFNGSQAQNLGYLLSDGTKGKAAGICRPWTKINSLTFQNVNTSGVTSATLTLNAFFNALRIRRVRIGESAIGSTAVPGEIVLLRQETSHL